MFVGGSRYKILVWFFKIVIFKWKKKKREEENNYPPHLFLLLQVASRSSVLTVETLMFIQAINPINFTGVAVRQFFRIMTQWKQLIQAETELRAVKYDVSALKSPVLNYCSARRVMGAEFETGKLFLIDFSRHIFRMCAQHFLWVVQPPGWPVSILSFQ